MINKDSQISLTYELRGLSLATAGVYTSAKVHVTNGFTKNEVFKLVRPIQVIKPAVYSKAAIQITLNSSFVQHALEQPKKPEKSNYHRWLRTTLGKASQGWRKLSDEAKLKLHIEQYVEDMGGEEYSFEII